MATATAADVTVVVTERWIEGVKRLSRGTLTIAATTTYPTGGYPLTTTSPAVAAPKRFGMDRQLDDLRINADTGLTTATTADYTYAYEKKNKKLQLFYGATGTSAAFQELKVAATPGAKTVSWTAIGW